ncbi:MAG: hypothetical protein C4526_01125 [Nitrospiraceae bacterium]|nr:MAG: hypothetical protein C4526_01125 [Nitrospiraceae bacterium]
MIKIIILLVSLWLTYNTSYAQDENMKEGEFNLQESLSATDSIQKSLKVFSDITDIAFTDNLIDEIYSRNGSIKVDIDTEKFKKIDRKEISWRKQNLINPNNILRIKGTLLKMEMEINRLRYENAQIEKDKISQKDLEQIKQKCIQSKTEFENFMKTHHWYE